jgi:hypothetical protein
MRTLINFLILLLIIFCVVFFHVFIVLVFLSMAIVPLTWAYAQLMGQSYSFTIDQSEILYRLNILGQWSLVIGGGVLLLSMFFFL